MNQALRGTGLLLVLAGIVLLLVREKLGELPVPPLTLMGAGALTFAAGLLLSVMNRASRAVVRRRCVRCGRAVQAGEPYCTEHFREAIDRIRDSQSA